MKRSHRAIVLGCALCVLLAGLLYGGRKALFNTEEFLRPEAVAPLQTDAFLEFLRLEWVAKNQLIEELLAEHLTLFEAAARFQALDLARPERLPKANLGFAGQTEEERRCRQVLHWAQLKQDEPNRWLSAEERLRAERLLARLREDLCRRLQEGAILLPEVSAEETEQRLSAQ